MAPPESARRRPGPRHSGRASVAGGQSPAGRVLAAGVMAEARPVGYALRPGLSGASRSRRARPEWPQPVAGRRRVFPGPGVANVLRSGLRARRSSTRRCRGTRDDPARPSAICVASSTVTSRAISRRHFHRVCLWDECGLADLARDRPLLVLMTHFSWWDVSSGDLARSPVLAIGATPRWTSAAPPLPDPPPPRQDLLDRPPSTAGLRGFLRVHGRLLQTWPGRVAHPAGRLIAPSRRRPLGFSEGPRRCRCAGRPRSPFCRWAGRLRSSSRSRGPEVFIRVGSPRRWRRRRSPSPMARRLEGISTPRAGYPPGRAGPAWPVERFRSILDGRKPASAACTIPCDASERGGPDARARHATATSSPIPEDGPVILVGLAVLAAVGGVTALVAWTLTWLGGAPNAGALTVRASRS